MNFINQSILQCFWYICQHKKRGYVTISQETALELLQTYYNVDICRRTLNYHLRELEDSGYIQRIKRHSRGSENQVLFATTLSKILKPALKFLARLAYWFKDVSWKVRSAATQIVEFNKVEFQRQMNENYRRRYGLSS